MARPRLDSARDSADYLGFGAKRWPTADKPRNNLDASQYKRVVIGFISLKYTSYTFEEHRAKLVAAKGDYAGANPEEPDQYEAEKVCLVPADARWLHFQKCPTQPTIGKTADDATVATKRDNLHPKGVLPKDYARLGLDTEFPGGASLDYEDRSRDYRTATHRQRLDEDIDVLPSSQGDKIQQTVDLLGRVSEDFLTRLASLDRKNDGQFHTPSCVLRCLVAMPAPYNGRIFAPACVAPACGSGGMFVQVEKQVESHGGKPGDIAMYGQDNWTRRRSQF
jgi:type I restriction enzyme M protein